jgi:hypothetical protein
MHGGVCVRALICRPRHHVADTAALRLRCSSRRSQALHESLHGMPAVLVGEQRRVACQSSRLHTQSCGPWGACFPPACLPAPPPLASTPTCSRPPRGTRGRPRRWARRRASCCCAASGATPPSTCPSSRGCGCGA